MQSKQRSKKRTVINDGCCDPTDLLSHCCLRTDCRIIGNRCCIPDAIERTGQRRIPAVDCGVRQRNAVIAFQQRIILGFRDFGTDFDSQL